jgi:hypothetical protein
MQPEPHFNAEAMVDSVLGDLTAAAVHVWSAANANFDGGKLVLNDKVIAELQAIGRRIDRVARSVAHSAKRLGVCDEEPF